jgi:hypothetical protein
MTPKYKPTAPPPAEVKAVEAVYDGQVWDSLSSGTYGEWKSRKTGDVKEWHELVMHHSFGLNDAKTNELDEAKAYFFQRDLSEKYLIQSALLGPTARYHAAVLLADLLGGK